MSITDPRAESLEPRRLFATFTVTTDADSGPGSLRDAVAQANAAGGTDAIHFAIGSGLQTIAPPSPLPAVTGTTAIDATTQPGHAGSPLVLLPGGNLAGDNLTVNAANSTVRGLVANGFAAAAGVRLTANADGTTVSNCHLARARRRRRGGPPITRTDGD